MNYISVKECSIKWKISERSVRDYCNKGRIEGAILEGKTWLIPSNALKPIRIKRHIIKKESLLDILKREKENKVSGGIYHKIQIEMTYNSNHIEGSKLTHDQTRYIFETKTISATKEIVSVDDVLETTNHFRCIDLAILNAKNKLTESLIKQFHFVLKNNTSDMEKTWFKIGDYKLIDNEVGGIKTASSKEVKNKMKELLDWYNSLKNITYKEIIEFHYQFECIHPFQDGNGRVGRLIMFKECLKNNIVPMIILDQYKEYYYRGLKEYKNQKEYLIDTCLFGQDIFKEYLNYFNIEY